MKRKFWLSLSLFLSTIFLMVCISGCYNDKADLIIPNNDCDTSVNISYQSTVVSILRQNCYVCHDADNYATSGGFRQLDQYSTLLPLINSGKLLKAINHEPGAAPMPLGRDKLSDCDIMRISAWVTRGAPNN